MLKKFTAIFLAFVFSVIAFTAMPLSASAVNTFNSNDNEDFTYNTYSEGGIEITGYNGNVSELIIPDEIDGKKVVSIGEYAFFKNTNLTSVVIPDTVTVIGLRAFQYCTNIKSVTIPESVTKISDYAFRNCKRIKSIIFPSGVKIIGTESFAYCTCLENVEFSDTVTSIESCAFFCTNLESVNIPYSVTTLHNDAFDGTYTFKSITVDERNSSYSSINGVLFNKNKDKILKYPAGKNDTEVYIIPDSVKCITDGAFYYCKNLKNIIIPNTVETIMYYAFSGCTGFTTITIPASVTSIDYGSFDYCYNLESIIVDDKNEFYSSSDGVLFTKNKDKLLVCPDNKVGEYTVPDGVEFIDQFAFGDCGQITSIELPNTVTNIGLLAFRNCTGLKKINIPDSVTVLTQFAFRDCTSLEEIVIPGSLTAIDYNTFYNCTGLKKVTILPGVKYIHYSSFKNCTSLTDVAIYGELTYIEGDPFYNCINLKSVTIFSMNCKISGNAFGYYSDNGSDAKMSDFKVYGYKDSTAESYANKQGFKFIPLKEIYTTGDADSDETVDVNDVTMIQMQIAGEINDDGSYLIEIDNRAFFDSIDMDSDGKLSVNDVTELQSNLSENY